MHGFAGQKTLPRADNLQSMCNLYSITTNQAAIIALFRVMNRYVGNLPPMPGVFPGLSRSRWCATPTPNASW